VALVSELVHEIESFDIPPIEAFRKLRVGNRFSIGILILKLLGLSKSCFEPINVFSKLFDFCI
jgi:hypothetical protein